MPKGIPECVEVLAEEIREDNPRYSERQVWATAWSVYCAHVEPGSKHCKKKRGAYLRKNPPPPAEVTYVGDLVSVDVSRGTVEVEPTPLGVCEGIGLVTAETRCELARGIIYERPRGRKVQLRSFTYFRDRDPGPDYWTHESPGAFVVLSHDWGGDGLPVPWVESTGARRCNRPGDFVCGS